MPNENLINEAAKITIDLTILIVERRKEQLKNEDMDAIRMAQLEIQIAKYADQMLKYYEDHTKEVEEKGEAPCLKVFSQCE